jgi:hypothetical protein
MSPKVFNAVDDSVHGTESTDDSSLLIGKVSDHLIVSRQKTHHKFASGFIELFLGFYHLLLRTQSIR